MEEVTRKRTRLDVPDATARDRSLLVNTPGQPPWKGAEPLQDSVLLGRLQSFLPAMQKANEELEQTAAREPDSCDIESVTEGAPHIEMNLACGVLDLKDSSAAAAAHRAVNVANSADAFKQLPVLKEDDMHIVDTATEPGILDMSRAAAGPDGELLTERASRRTGSTDKKGDMDSSCMVRQSEDLCSLRKTEDHSVAASDPPPPQASLGPSQAL